MRQKLKPKNSRLRRGFGGQVKSRNCSGFTLIEIFVVLAIFAVLTGTILTNYGKFNVNVSLDNLVHQVALVIRQAQVYGISVSQSSLTSQQFKGYGVYFSVATLADQKVFIMFNDRNPQDGKYSPGASPCTGGVGEECVDKISIQSGDIVEKIIVNEKTSFPGTPAKEAHIVFTRPDPDARVTAYRLSDGSLISGPVSDISVYLLSPRNDEKKVVVWSTGQIAVE